MIRKFLQDESGASAAKVGLFGTGVTLLAYGWFHTGGAMMFNFTDTVTSVIAAAISHMIGRPYYF